MKGGYVLRGRDEIAFALAACDRSRPLVIDPLLTYLSYLGGDTHAPAGDEGFSIAVDSAGAAWVASDVLSADFPTTAGAFQTNNFGDGDIAISKFSPDGSTLEFSTYAGGIMQDFVGNIAVDPAGDAFVVGGTHSADFPVSAGAYLTTFSPSSLGSESFVIALDTNGGLIYSTFLPAGAVKLAANFHGEAAVTGFAVAPDESPPSTADALNTRTSGEEACAFVTELNADGTGIIFSANFYSTYLPTGGGTEGFFIGFDAQGNLYFTGQTDVPFTFPAPPSGTFVAKLDPTG